MNTYSNSGKKNFSRQSYGGSIRLLVIPSALIMIVALLLTPFTGIISSVAAAGMTDSVIIELNDDAAAVWKAKQQKAGQSVSAEQLAAYRGSLKTKQDQFLADLSARGIGYEVAGVNVPNFDGTNAGHVPFRYNLVLNGISLKIPTSALSTIRSMPQVKKVEPTRVMSLDLEKSVDYVRAPQVYGQFKELTPFDNFREGFEGQGMNVAVLDTGIDWSHAMFGGDPTPPRLGLSPNVAALTTNQKVTYYMSFTGGLPDGYGHGTAAASNIGGYLGIAPGLDKIPGTLDDIRLHGVAPQAKLMAYKVCVDVGRCLSNSTIMAIEDAVSPTTLDLQPKPVAHVINMSLGGAGTPDDLTAVASDNASLLGTIVVASAGNEGPGLSTVGSPAAGRHVIAVGANTDPAGGSNTIDVVAGDRSGIIANVLDGSAAITSDLVGNYVFCGLAETPADVPDSVRGKIALIARGSTYNAPALPVAGSVGTGLFSNKAAFALAKGATAAVIYNNIDGELTAATARASTIPVVGLSKANGEYLKSIIGSTAVGAVSAKQIRLNAATVFDPAMADFSSRGPVAGLGQIKPDVTAPGVGVLSATVRAGVVDGNTGSMFDPTGYIHASGTSFSGPHVAGAAALVKQAHLDWTPDMVRTALINTATNLRTSAGTPRTDGPQADHILSQGGGLISVQGAVNAKALMGVEADGIVLPGILGSHSFGEAAILNNRIVNTKEVTVTIRDTSGTGGTYNLSTANNRYFDRPGITASVSPSSVIVPAGGSATFTAKVTIDGNQVRDENVLDLQWYVKAQGASASLRMPMFFRATPSLPAAGGSGGTTTTEEFSGVVLAGDAGAQHDNEIFIGGTYSDHTIEVAPNAKKLDATLTFTDAEGLEFGASDLDLYVLDPDGNVVGSGAIAGGPEVISIPVSRGGTYTYRVYGWLAANTPYTLTSTLTLGGGAPNVSPIAANFVETSTGNRYDFDGSFNVTWQPTGDVDGYEVERSADGTNWNVVQALPGTATGVSFANVAEGNHQFRVRAIVPGQIGKFVTPPSNVQAIIVARRSEVDATASIEALNRSIVFPSGSTEIVTALKNTSSSIFYPNVRFEIVSVSSTGNSVRVTNSENGGDGVATVAAFDYSQLVGSDFIAGEESGNKTLRFNNPNNILFTFTARVKANVATGTGGTTSGGSTGGTSGGTSGGGGQTGGGVNNAGGSKLFKFTVNPITRLVTVQLL